MVSSGEFSTLPGAKGWDLVLWVHHFAFLFPSVSKTKMNNLFDKKPKKSTKYSQRNLFGIPTNIVAGPLGFRVAELDAGSKGEQNRPHQDFEVD